MYLIGSRRADTDHPYSVGGQNGYTNREEAVVRCTQLSLAYPGEFEFVVLVCIPVHTAFVPTKPVKVKKDVIVFD